MTSCFVAIHSAWASARTSSAERHIAVYGSLLALPLTQAAIKPDGLL
jgi:hypothetical protein